MDRVDQVVRFRRMGSVRMDLADPVDLVEWILRMDLSNGTLEWISFE